MTYKATFAKKLSCQIAGGLLVALMAASTLTYAQSAAVSSVVPNVVNYNGTLSNASGKPTTAISGVTFSLYKDSEGGAPLWMETQNLQPDSRGHFSAKLGSASGRGLPADLFASGEARWLGVRPQGQEEQARVLLLSVPYALKALDAETLGGKPASRISHRAIRELGCSLIQPPTSPDRARKTSFQCGPARPSSEIRRFSRDSIGADWNRNHRTWIYAGRQRRWEFFGNARRGVGRH